MLTACKENKTTFSLDDYLYVIDLNKTEFIDIKLSKLFESVTPVVLETTKESLIGFISKVVTTPEYIIVLDNDISDALFLFRKDGTFLHKFGRVGNGPGEYASVYDFCYDSPTGTVYMLDSQSSRVNLYDIHTGSFLKSIKLNREKGLSRHIYCHIEELYTDLSYFPEGNGYLLNRRNQLTGEIEEAWFDVKKYAKNIDRFTNNPFLFGDGSSFKFHTRFMDGIMLVEKGKITPFLTFTPEYTLTEKEVQSLDLESSNYYEELYKMNKVYDIFNYFEHKDLLFLQFYLSGGARTIIYNQKTKDFKCVNMLFNDLIYKDIDHFTFTKFVTCDDNGMYAWLDGYDLKNGLKKDIINENFKSKATDLFNLEEDANPILLYYEFKD